MPQSIYGQAKLRGGDGSFAGRNGRAYGSTVSCLGKKDDHEQAGSVWVPFGQSPRPSIIPGLVMQLEIMFGVVNIAALENYFRHVEKLVTQYPQCWGLVMVADDTARPERLEEIRRHLGMEAGWRRQVSMGWDELDPWSVVFEGRDLLE